MTDRYCTSCGALLDPNWRFCGGCGRAIEPQELSTPSSSTPAPIGPSPASIAPSPTASGIPPFAEVGQQRSRRSIAPILAILVVGAVAIGAVALMSSKPGQGAGVGQGAATRSPRSGVTSSNSASADPTNPRLPNGMVDGPGFRLQIPVGYTVVNDGSDGSNFTAALNGNPMTGSFVIVSHQSFSGSLDKAAEHYENVIWEGRTVFDLGPANLSGVGAEGRHMVLSGFAQGSIDAYIFVHGSQLWELRLSTSELDRPGVAASFAFD